MARAKRKISQPKDFSHEGNLRRMEQVAATLESYVIADGWHESWESGPMPKMAAEALAYFRPTNRFI